MESLKNTLSEKIKFYSWQKSDSYIRDMNLMRSEMQHKENPAASTEEGLQTEKRSMSQKFIF